jgi:hypothetical protein
MLQNNIYIVYPAGYGGSFIRWCLRKSEQDTAESTLDNPINIDPSGQFGGAGTAHLELRKPTHAGIEHLMYWTILNQPKEKLIYLVNAWNNLWRSRTFVHLLNMDRDPVIIHITDANKDSRELANLNAVTKWPLIFELQFHNARFGIDFYNLQDTLQERNIIVKYYDTIFGSSSPMKFNDNPYSVIEGEKNPRLMASPEFYDHLYECHNQWYTVRNNNTPHEVNGEEFVTPYKVPKHYYTIDVQDIYSNQLFEKLERITSDSNVGTYNFDYAKQFHPTYVEHQSNLQYLDEMQEFRKTKTLTPYLTSHPYIKAMVIRDMLPKLNQYDWESKSLEEIVLHYSKL